MYTYYTYILAFNDNKKAVVLQDGTKLQYLYVSMTPSNWYQWFDPNPPDDRAWMTVCI